jgi:uncharacterized repeat protein (TIGR01451 family)
VPASSGPGQRLEYRLCVENSSRAAAHHVTVRNPIPEHARFVEANPKPTREGNELFWRLGTLEGCACREIALVLEPTGGGDVRNCARVQFEHGQCVTTRISRPQVRVSKSGPTQATLNQTVTFRLQVTNTGSVPVRDLTLADVLDAGLEYPSEPPPAAGGKQQLTWDIKSLAPGQTETRTYQAVAKKEGKLCNTAEVSGPGGVYDRATQCVTVGASALSLDLTGPDEALARRPARYNLSVGNRGTLPAANVRVVLPVPAGVDFVEASPGGEFRDGQVSWFVGPLAAAARPRSLWVRLVAPSPGEVMFRGTATADGGLRYSAQMTTTFTGGSGLTFLTEPDENPVFVGGETGVTVTVINQGSEAARGVQLTVVVPPELRVVSRSGPDGQAVAGGGGTITFDKLAELGPQKEARYRVMLSPLKAGDVRLEGRLSAERPAFPKPVVKQAPITVADPG